MTNRLVVLLSWLLSQSRGEPCRRVCTSSDGVEEVELYNGSRMCNLDNLVDRCVDLEAAVAMESEAVAHGSSVPQLPMTGPLILYLLLLRPSQAPYCMHRYPARLLSCLLDLIVPTFAR
jgi:hypothetical protein